MENLRVRAELATDKDDVFNINTRAFEQPNEAHLVDAIRRSGQAALSLVALLDEKLVAHIMYSPVRVENNPKNYTVWGLGPIAVLPENQRQGIGKALLKTSLEQCRARGVAAVVLLGHSSYYPKFGFEPAAAYGLSFKGEFSGDAFMVLELIEGVRFSLSGAVYYVPAFDSV